MNSRYTESSKWLERSLRSIPMGAQTFSKSHTQFPAGAAPLYADRAEGCRLWDVDGNEYLDCVSALLAVLLGYCDEQIDAAVSRQMKKGVSFSLPTRLEAELAERMAELIPCVEQVQFAKNGSDVTAAAIRLARAVTGRERVAVCGYHGWQDWYIASTTRNLGIPATTAALTRRFEYNNLASLEKLFADKDNRGEVAAVILEPMNTQWPVEGFLQGIRDLCSRHGSVLIFDEVITGFRFHGGGAQTLFGVTPDLATFGKGMANGYPLSALGGRRELMQQINQLFVSTTFGGEALSLAASIAVIDRLQSEPVLQAIHASGENLQAGLQSLIRKHDVAHLCSTSGHPSWSFLHLHGQEQAPDMLLKTLFIQEMCARGILTLGSHNLNLAHSQTDAVLTLLAAYDEVLPLLREAATAGDMEQRLTGKALVPLFSTR